MESLGMRLRARRESLGWTLDEVEKETKIRKHYLEALENDEHQLLPAMVYASGFVKRYAQLLDMDPQEALEEFRRGVVPKVDAPMEVLNLPLGNKRKLTFPVRNIFIAILFLIIVIWSGIFLVNYLTSQYEATHPSPAASEAPISTPAEPAVQGINLELAASEACWLRITVDDQPMMEETLQPGESRQYTANEKAVLVLGNAGGVSMVYNGQEMGLAGDSGQVMTLTFPPQE